MGRKVIGIWVRVSSPMQVQKESHVHHEMRAKAFVKSRNWKIGKTYRLKAMSGMSIMDYPETKQMMHDIKTGVISGLVFTKIARLARNTGELIELSKLFREHNADLISMDMSIDTSTPIGRHFFRQMSSMAEWEREMIADRIAGSIAVRAELGKHIGGQSPFGFRYVNKKLTTDPDEAPIRKLMFELFLKHKRKKTVANILNEHGHRTRKGNKFTDSTVKRLLTDPVAKGLHIMNRRYSSSSKPNKFKPKEEWYFHEVESIVTEEVWNKVNDIITSQKKNHTKVLNTKVHLFTGFVFCQCGARMYTRYNSENYVCQSSCGNRIRKDDLEEIFRSELHNYTVSKDKVDDYFKRLKVVLKDREKEVGKLKKDKEKLDAKIESLLVLHAEGKIPTESFHTYHQKPYEQMIQIEERILELQQDISLSNNSQVTTNEVLELAKNLFEKWVHLGHQEKREIIETIAEKIIVSSNEIDIHLYKILPNNESYSFFETTTNGQHTLSNVALVGGGSYPQPGEISLSHNGVLFLDELPEFKREVLEVMRQPLEDREVTISRAKFTVTYPSSFMLVASMNPSPSGYFNDPDAPITSSPAEMQRYMGKISGPLLDRIDIHIEVTPVPFEKLADERNGESSVDIRKRVTKARENQTERFKDLENIHYNAQMNTKQIRKYCKLDDASMQLLKSAMERLNLSARAYDRILKVSRTIADLEGSKDVLGAHISEAIQYRSLDREGWLG
jgi:DNA invertase Pin-like site-specific DNA recombinase